MHITGMPWKRDGKETGTQQGVTKFCCAFQRDSGCQYKCRILRNLCDGSCSIEQTKSIAHADHKKKITKTGVHKLVKAEFLKPGSNLQQGSSKNIRRVLQELDLPDRDGKMLYQAMQFRQRERNKELTQFVDQASLGTWGGVHQWCVKNEKEAVKERLLQEGLPFDSNTSYVLKGWEADADQQCCIIVQTTENLILNAYRYSCASDNGKVLLAMDHTYRLVHEGHATLLVGTISPDQSAHLIAYATCTDETGKSITKVLQAIAEESKEVLIFRARHNIMI